jgi:hypothetical protein
MLVEAMKLKHTLNEVQGLALALRGSAERILDEHRNKGNIKNI